jgi:hypothetical protein
MRMIKVDDIVRVNKRLRLDEGWLVLADSEEERPFCELKVGWEMQMEHLYWTTGDSFDPDCGICFKIINVKNESGPEFSSAELNRLLQDGALGIINE